MTKNSTPSRKIVIPYSTSAREEERIIVIVQEAI